MKGLTDIFAGCARDGLCGGGASPGRCSSNVGGSGEDDESAAPPIPKVIHLTAVEDDEDEDLVGLDFLEHQSLLPTDLLHELDVAVDMDAFIYSRSSPPPPPPDTSLEHGELVPKVKNQRAKEYYPPFAVAARQEKGDHHSTASSLEASAETNHAQFLDAWTNHACVSSPAKMPSDYGYDDPLPSTMAYVFPFRYQQQQKPNAGDNFDGSSYSSLEDCRYNFWAPGSSSRPPKISSSPSKQEATARTEESSVASC